MTVFYDRLSHHQDKAEALREAQLEMLNSGSPPYYWAGFVLNGEPSGSLFRETAVNSSSRSGE
jgi:CHAT domain-containing protein